MKIDRENLHSINFQCMNKFFRSNDDLGVKVASLNKYLTSKMFNYKLPLNTNKPDKSEDKINLFDV